MSINDSTSGSGADNASIRRPLPGAVQASPISVNVDASKAQPTSKRLHPADTRTNVANSLGQSIVPRLLTVKQAAAYISSPVWTVRTLIWSREIKVIRKGKAYLIP